MVKVFSLVTYTTSQYVFGSKVSQLEQIPHNDLHLYMEVSFVYKT